MRLQLKKLKYSLEEVCEITGESRSNITKAIKAGHLEVFVVGKRKCCTPSAAEKFIEFLKRESDAGRPVMYQARARA